MPHLPFSAFSLDSRLAHWLHGTRWGDGLVLLCCIVGVAGSFKTFWQSGGLAEWAVIRQNGIVVAELDLHKTQHIEVHGPLGKTRIEIGKGQARVAADPSPRQYCVRQGWLSRNGEVAICAPNQVSLQITGRQKAYDSLAY